MSVVETEGKGNSSERIEDFEIYRLDYETQATAAGGELLLPGDHVYFWCTLYQHHGIVLTTYHADESSSADDDSSILIAEFTNEAILDVDTIITSSSTASGAVSTGVTGGFRIVKESEPNKWHKVKYHANPLESMTWRPGTCSAACPSSSQTILTRVQFLNECRHLIPDYHVLASNCETVAVWCVTGKWQTLQGGQAMQLSKIGALTSIGIVPLGVGIPVGIVASGLTIWHSMHINKRWEETSNILNKEYEWYAMGKRPELKFKPTTV